MIDVMNDKTSINSYVVCFWDEYDQVQRKATGYVPGATIMESVAWLSNYYGEENLLTIEIDMAEAGPMELTTEKV